LQIFFELYLKGRFYLWKSQFLYSAGMLPGLFERKQPMQVQCKLRIEHSFKDGILRRHDAAAAGGIGRYFGGAASTAMSTDEKSI